MRGYFIAGTDTGVGKTEIARALLTLLPGALALKPFETGCDPAAPEDALALQKAGGDTQSLDAICPYRFRMPAAPLVAAEAEGRTIDLSLIEKRVAAAAGPIIVEAAGGLLVPLAREISRDSLEADEPDHAPATALVTNLDLAERLGLPVVLVGRAGLGTLNHCALSAQALASRGLQIAAIVLNRVSPDDDPTVASNPRLVEEMTGALVLGPTPFVRSAGERPRALLEALSVLR
jgi:dethiobiotin synthetase